MAPPEASTPMPPPAESAPTPEAWQFEIGLTGKQKKVDGGKPLEMVDDVVTAGEDAAIDRMSDLKALFLCDGMGGYAGGDVAAKIITTSAADVSERQHKDGDWHGATHDQAQQLLAEQLRQAESWMEHAKRPGGDLEDKQEAGGTVGFVQFFNDHEGKPCLAGLSIGDPTMALADRTTGKVIDLNQEETLGAVSGRVNGAYNKAHASTLSNVVRGSKRGEKRPAHLNEDGIQNTFVVSLEPGHEYAVVNSSDGIEEVFKKRDHFREHTPDYSKGGNLDLELENIMLNTPTPQGIAKALEQEADRRRKDDDQLIQVVQFTAPAPTVTPAPGTGEQTIPPSNPAEQKGSPEWFDKIDQEYPPVLADEIRATLREAGTEAMNGNAQEALQIIARRVEELQATFETTVDVNQEAQLRRISALYPAAAMLYENRDVLGISDEAASARMGYIEKIMAQHEDYFGSVAEAFAEDGTLPTEEELQRIINDGDYYKLDLLSRYDIPYEMEVKIDAMFNALSAPVTANIPEERLHYDIDQDPEIAKVATKASLGSRAAGAFVKAKDFTKNSFNNYYFRAGMAGHRVQQLRVTRALLTFTPFAFLAGAGASYLAHKAGIWGGGGGAPSVTEHHAAPAPEATLPGGHEVAAMPQDASPTIDLGDNHSLILPDGYAAHDTGSGYELYHGNQHVANLNVHFDADGHLSPAEQKLLTQQLHAAGIDIDLKEITQNGAEHAQQIDGDDLDRRWFDNNSVGVDGNEGGLDVMHMGDGRVAIDISSMDHVSHLGSQSLDPQHTPMHALLTDSNGHTYDLPMHGNRIVFDTHSDVGKMLSDGSYHKIEIAQLDGHTANIVSTDFGHGGGELPDNPTTGGEGQVGTGNYEVQVTADNSHPLVTETTPRVETPPPTPLPATPEADTSSTGTNLAVGAVAGGTVAAALGGVKVAQNRAANTEAKQEKVAAEERKKQAKDELPAKVQQAAALIAEGITPGRILNTPDLEHVLQEATADAFAAGLPPADIEQALADRFSLNRNFPGTVRVQEDGRIEILPSATVGSMEEWVQHERLMERVAVSLKTYAESEPGFDIYTPESQGEFFTTVYAALEDEARFSEIIDQLKIKYSLQRVESGGRTRFKVRPEDAGFVAHRLREELGER